MNMASWLVLFYSPPGDGEEDGWVMLVRWLATAAAPG